MARTRLTRRDFLKTAAVAPLGAAIAGSGLEGAAAVRRPVQSGVKSRVVLVRDAKAVGEGRAIDAQVVARMLDDAVATLLGEKDPVAAWKRLIRPDDVVGIKTNVWNYLPTGPALEDAIRRRVMDAGIPEDRIGVRDRGVLTDPLFQKATAFVNVRPARVHYWSGMGSCIKNYIMFVPKPPEYHGDACADLAAIWSLPHVRGRTRLNILSMLTPLYHNIGPRGFSESYLWAYGGLIVGQDVVAVDATGYRIIQARRLEAFGEDRPLETSAHHIQLADTRHHLGRSDPGAIELVKLGREDGALI